MNVNEVNHMNLDAIYKELDICKSKSVNVYMYRQRLQAELMKTQHEIHVTEMELMKLDGQEELLHSLINKISANEMSHGE